MQRDDSICVRHILDAARKAIAFSQSNTRADLDTNEMLALSLVRPLEIVGEAANGISSGFRDKHPDIPWKPRMVPSN
jgi:uncharacterized protein with HEPN domain